MFEEKLNRTLTAKGYKRMNSNAQGIYLYLLTGEKESSIISVIYTPSGEEMTQEQYLHILDQMRNNTGENQPISILSLLLTNHPEKAKNLIMTDRRNSHWIVDMAQMRLMIFETQGEGFSDIARLIEELLAQEQTEQNPLMEEPKKKRISITLINSILVVLNVLAYLITHYTNAFGSPDEMFLKGALSWYQVIHQQEYYRILTSMFMHADINHLFGNLLVLIFLGTNLERTVGKWKYILIYFGSGILAGIASIGYNMLQEYNTDSVHRITYGIGASGAIFGVVGALLFILLIHRGTHNGISASQVIIFTGINIVNGMVDRQISQVAHVGGLISGFLLALCLYRRKQKETKEGSS